MDLNAWIQEFAHVANGGVERSDAELALGEGVALLGTVLVAALRVVDTVVEMWPLPISRVRR